MQQKRLVIVLRPCASNKKHERLLDTASLREEDHTSYRRSGRSSRQRRAPGAEGEQKGVKCRGIFLFFLALLLP